jgi:hypothetical protein
LQISMGFKMEYVQSMYYDYKYHAIIVSTVLRSHMNLKAGEDTRVCAKTYGKFFRYMIEKDESIRMNL